MNNSPVERDSRASALKLVGSGRVNIGAMGIVLVFVVVMLSGCGSSSTGEGGDGSMAVPIGTPIPSPTFAQPFNEQTAEAAVVFAIQTSQAAEALQTSIAAERVAEEATAIVAQRTAEAVLQQATANAQATAASVNATEAAHTTATAQAYIALTVQADIDRATVEAQATKVAAEFTATAVVESAKVSGTATAISAQATAQHVQAQTRQAQNREMVDTWLWPILQIGAAGLGLWGLWSLIQVLVMRGAVVNGKDGSTFVVKQLSFFGHRFALAMPSRQAGGLQVIGDGSVSDQVSELHQAQITMSDNMTRAVRGLGEVVGARALPLLTGGAGGGGRKGASTGPSDAPYVVQRPESADQLLDVVVVNDGDAQLPNRYVPAQLTVNMDADWEGD